MNTLHVKAALALALTATIIAIPQPAFAAFKSNPKVFISDSFYVDKGVRSVPVKKDDRVEILRAYLQTHNSPMVDSAKDFVEAADKYNLDWKLVAAIAGVESTFGKHTPGGGPTESYNAWGWGVYGDNSLGFGSWKNGIYTVSRGLRENYINKGLTEPLAMNRKYASSKTWGIKVNFFLGKIGAFEQQYRAENGNIAIEPIQFDVQTAGESARPFTNTALGGSA